MRLAVAVIGRRALLRLGLGLGLCLGLGLAFHVGFAFHGAQLGAIAEQLSDQEALVINRSSLFHDQKAHQAIGNQEQNDQDWKHGVLRLWRRH